MTSIIKGIGILLANLPQILRLIEEIQKAQAEASIKRRVADDFKAIEEAFKAKDGDALNRIFNP